MIELGINIEDTSQLEELKEISTEEKDNSNSDVSSNEPETEKVSTKLSHSEFQDSLLHFLYYETKRIDDIALSISLKNLLVN